jgi:hypothetical protein
MPNNYKTIERGSRGATYKNGDNVWTVYQHGTYPRSSVLAGQHRRQFLDEFDSEEAARAAYPDAQVSGDTYTPPVVHHLPDDGDPEPADDN